MVPSSITTTTTTTAIDTSTSTTITTATTNKNQTIISSPPPPPTHSTKQLPILGGIDIKVVPLYFAVFVYGLLAYENASVIFTGGVGKNGSTVAVRIPVVWNDSDR